MQLRGRLDKDGLATLSGVLPTESKGLVQIASDVFIGGGMTGGGTATATVDNGQVSLWVIPESGQLVSEMESGVWVVTQRPDGSPLSAKVRLMQGGKAVAAVQTGEDGLGWVTARLQKGAVRAVAQAGSRRGQSSLTAAATPALLQLDRAVLQGGEILSMSLRTKGRGVVIFEVGRGEQAMAATSAVVAGGIARGKVTLPKRLTGSVEVRAYVLDGDKVQGDTRLIYVRDPRDLTITMTADQESYRPGDSASIDIRVRDSQGRGVLAQLGMVAVDEGLRQLGLEQPGIERAMLRLSPTWDKRSTDVPDWGRSALVLASDWKRLAVLASAAEAAMGLQDPKATLEPRARQTVVAFTGAMTRRTKVAAKALTRFYERRGTRGKRAKPSDLVALKLMKKGTAVDPWGKAVRWKLELDGSCCRDFVYMTSAGVDGRFGTLDDIETNERFTYRRDRMCGCGFGAGGFGSKHARMGKLMASMAAVMQTQVRKYFPDTLAVNPALLTDADGRATWTIELADSLTTWLVQARGVSSVGGLGGAELGVRVEQPFSVDVAVPPELTRGDQLMVPVGVTNRTETERHVKVTATGGGTLSGSLTTMITVQPGQTGEVQVPLKATAVGEGSVTVRAEASGVADAVVRTMRVAPDGVPDEQTVTRILSASRPATMAYTVPAGAIPGTTRVAMAAYASPATAAVEGLESLLRRPNGCFEQTSSTTYPNALVLGYLSKQGRASPALEAKARALLEQGAKRLLTFEVEGGGFSWFGSAPANKLLTAYGVMEFEQIGALIPFDADVTARTRKWLLSQRNKDGSWSPDKAYLHAETWGKMQGANALVTAYIVWALSRGSLAPELEQSVEYLAAQPLPADPYPAAMHALALTTAAPDSPAAQKAREHLAGLARVETAGVSWQTEVQTGVYARGNAAAQETTALAVMALMQDAERSARSASGLSWLTSQRQARGAWSTTQATVLALEALLTDAGTKKAAKGRLAVGDTSMQIREQDFDVVRTVGLASAEGDHEVTASLSGEGTLSLQLAVQRYVPVADAKRSSTTPLTLAMDWPKEPLKAGTRSAVAVKLEVNRPVRMPTLQISMPAGVTVDKAALAAMGARAEVAGRMVTIYLERLTPETPFVGSIPFTPRRAGHLSPGVSTAFPYYSPDLAIHTLPARLTIAP